MKRISPHITMAEAIKSNTAIRLGLDNTPNEKQLTAMKMVAVKCFEPVRTHHGKAIGISSFFRGEKLNKALKGAKSSQHCQGEAIDIDADIFDNGITNKEIFEYILNHLAFDQLITEYPDKQGEPKWVHVSWNNDGANRGQVLVANKVNGRTTYSHYS